MASKNIHFVAAKTATKPVKVRFKTKSDENVSFKALKTVKQKELHSAHQEIMRRVYLDSNIQIAHYSTDKAEEVKNQQVPNALRVLSQLRMFNCVRPCGP